MADELYNGELTYDNDWANVDGKAASGFAVQKFIKDELNKKIQVFHSLDNETTNVLLGFTDDKLYAEWKAATTDGANDMNGEIAVSNYKATVVNINKATPQPYYTVSLENKELSNQIISTDGSVKIKIQFNAVDMRLDTNTGKLYPVYVDTQGKLVIKKQNTSGGWSDVNLVEDILVRSYSEDNPDPVELDLTHVTDNGVSVISLSIVETRNVDGVDKTYVTTELRYRVTKTTLAVTFASEWNKPFYLTGMLDTEKSITLSYYIEGIVHKYLRLKFTCTDPNSENYNQSRTVDVEIGEGVYTSNNQRKYSLTLSDNDSNQYKVTHAGVHNVEAYVYTMSGGKIIAESEHIHSQFLVIDSDSDTNPYIILNNINKNLINWTTQNLFEYAVYKQGANISTLPVHILLTDVNDDSAKYLDFEENINILQKNQYSNTLEIDSSEHPIVAKLSISVDNVPDRYVSVLSVDNTGGYAPTAGADFIFNPKLYSNNFSEEERKKIRNSAVSDRNSPDAIVPSEWSDNFNFNNDAWVQDSSGNKCLRVLGGQELKINYNPFSRWYSSSPNNTTNSGTIEMVFAARNIVDENLPLIRMCKYKENDNTKFNGWELKPLIGLYKTFTSDSDIAQDVWLHEDVITHVTVVVDGGFSGSLKTVKIYINGIINREFDIAATDIENGLLWDKPEGSIDNSDYARNIIIGNKDSGSDIDVYSIKVYKNKALTSAEVMQNYMSSLFTKEEKENFRAVNDILDETTNTISYEKCQKLGYNTILWRYRTNADGTPFDVAEKSYMLGLEYGHNSESEITGELVIHKYNYNSTTKKYELDPYRSGIIEHILAKGQGTSSMTYWKWNQRWQFDKIETGEVDADGEDITYDSTFHPMILGDRGWSDERIEQEKGLSQEEIASIKSKYVRSAYQVCEGVPFAQRLDGKINWASPMQSHKLGSVNLYNDVWKEVIGSNDITNVGATDSGKEFTNTNRGYNDCRVAIIQEPFFVFNQPFPGEAITFYGLYTVGPSKGDKPTFGYNKKDFVDYLMMEGMDNGAALVNCMVPWNNDDIIFKLDDKGKEIEHYGDKKNDGAAASGWEISMGAADKDRVDLTKREKVNPVLAMFKDMINFCYEHSHKLKPFKGNYNEFISPTNTEPIDTSYFYWMTSNTPNSSEHKAYNLYRFDTRSEQWVHAGINRSRDQFGNLIKDDNGIEIIQYDVLNLAEQLSDYLPENWMIQSSDSINNAFINARVAKYKGNDDDPDSGIRKYLHVNDLRYTLQMLKLICASDNWAKNTYIYNPGVYKEDPNGDIVRKHGKDNGDIKKGDIIKVGDEVKQYGAAIFATPEQMSDTSIQKYKLVSKFGFFQDDLDTILSLNNTGQKVKPYYTEEHDLDDVGKNYWNADENPLFRLPELAWPAEMQSMMYSILTAMANLAKNETGEDKVVACFDKYYGKITKYFPAVAYNAITSLLYESAFLEWNPPTDDGGSSGTGKYANGVNPLSQAVGDQSLGERYWFRRRSIYLSSYAGYGTFAAGDGNSSIGAVVFRSNKYNGADSKYEFHLTTSMWLYPRMMIGQGECFPTNKTGINGYKPRFGPGEEVVIKGSADGNTNVVIGGRDYYKSFGDWGKTVIDPQATAAINGNNLLEFVVTENAPHANYENIPGVIFDPDKLTISAPNIQKINIPGTSGLTKHINGDLNLQNSRKIKYVDITGTNIVGLKLPDNSNVEVLRLPENMTALNLTGLSKLSTDMAEDGKPKFYLSGTNDIINVTIKDCPKLNEYNIVKENFISKKAPLTSITLNNLNWVKTNKTRGVLTLDELKYLININNCDLQGIIEVDSNDIIDFGTKLTLLDKFGNIDDENNKLRVIYKKLSLVSQNSVKITGYKNIYTTGYYTFNVEYYSDVTNRIPANDFYEVKWSINNTNFGTVDEKTGVYHYIDNPAITDQNQRKVTISCRIKYLDEYGDEDVITKSIEIELFKALAKVGDYVYADGSYSPAENYAGDKKIVAVCFMAEDGSNVTPDNQKRLAVCYETIKDLYILKPSPKAYSGFHKRYWGDNTKDVPSLINYEYAGIVTQGNISGSLASILDGSWSDVNKLSSTIADYYEQYYPLIGDRYALSNIGWKTYDMTGIDTGVIEEGDIVSQGFLNTIYIINQRNSILGDNKPKEDNYNSEFANFIRASESGLSLSYYNAASYCYSYEPFNKNEDNSLATVQGLDDKFKKHNWYLPSIGELLILWRYLKANVGTTTGVYKGFGEVLKNNLSDGDQSQIWSSTESSTERAYNISAPISKTSDNDYLYGNSGIFSSQYGSKSSNNYYILPIVKF